MAKPAKKSASFEAHLARIETLVAELERQGIPLDQAISYYEEGITLIKQCQSLLAAAEQKVTLLSEPKQ